MDPKEITKADLVPSSSPGLNAQTVTPGPGGTTGTVPFISSKSLIPVSPVLQKNAVSSSPGFQSEKIVSRNCNGTVVLTSSPSNEAELQLYRVMQRASLLAYYDTLLEMGGDDVQQLCDAGEEEFLEIMALVGMASKPLHVRRLQKALQEWVTSPALFQTPLTLGGSAGPGPKCPSPQLSSIRPSSAPPTSSLPTSGLITSAVKEVLPPCMSPDGNQVAVEPNTYKEISTRGPSPCPVAAGGQRPVSPSLNSNPVLVEAQISRLAEIAEALVKTLPHLEPKPQNTKKKICRSLETVMNMAENDPKRMDEIRKYSAIYGRFDCKRNPQKPLTLHEVSVNEAAAQICRFAPALLTRRDDLFSLARQVVRDSGYHFTKAHTGMVPFGKTQTFHWSGKSPEESSSKKARLDSSCDANDMEKPKRQERLERIAEELKILGVKTDELVQAAQQVRQNNDLSAVQALQQEMEAVQNKQTQLLVEQSELLKQPLPSRIYRRNGNKIYSNPLDVDRTDTDDTDSQFSLSNASSPSQEVGDSRDSFYREGDTIANTSNGAHSAVKSPAKQTGKQVGPK